MPFTIRSLFLLPLLLSGCAITPSEIDREVATGEARITREIPRASTPAPAVVVREGRWLAGREVPLDEPLPAEIRQRVRLLSATPASLRQIAQRVAAVARIPVHLEPDVFADATSGTSTTNTTTGQQSALPGLPLAGQSGLTLPDLPLPTGPLDLTGVDSGDPGETRITYNHDGPLHEFLDEITARFGLAWEYKDGRIAIQRYITRTFVLYLPPEVRQVEAEVGGEAQFGEQAQSAITSGDDSSGSSSGSAGGTTGSQTQQAQGIGQRVRSEARLAAWEETTAAIQRLLTDRGRVATIPSSGEIVVTDTPPAVQRVAAFVGQKNASLTRQIAIQVDVVSVDSSLSDDFGINWNLIFQGSEVGASLITPDLITGATADLALQILRPNSDFQGTSGVIRALSQHNRGRVLQSSVATTLNNVPAPIQVTRTDGFLRSIQTNVTGTTGVVSTELVPGQVTTGFVATVTPRILDRDRVLLSYNIDLSRLLGFTSASIGSGDNASSIQIPNFERRALIQSVAVRAGDTLVLSGFEQIDDRADESGPVRPDNVAFGSRSLTRARTRLVILLTPVLVGNGAV